MVIGAVLNQEQRPVVYASHTPCSAEKNYTVTERECLAVVYSLNKFRTHLSALPVKVITDHAALTRLTNGKNLSSRMIGWVLKLAEFNIEWEHRTGTQNVVADVLSRNPVHQANRTERVNRDLVQIIANYVNDQHDTWDQFLCNFAYTIGMAVNETTVKTPTDLFLGRKLIPPFQKLLMVSDGTEFAVVDIEKLFDEARRNTKAVTDLYGTLLLILLSDFGD
ncbi:retrovirus-related Pol polyprotein from transposon opus, partial [Trichonephila clavipes]